MRIRDVRLRIRFLPHREIGQTVAHINDEGLGAWQSVQIMGVDDVGERFHILILTVCVSDYIKWQSDPR